MFEVVGNAAPDIGNYSLHDFYWDYWIVPSFESNEEIGAKMDGLFIDNLGPLYVSDYREEHMHYNNVTLTYSKNSQKPVIYVPAVFTEYVSYVKRMLEQRYDRHIPLMGNLGIGYPLTMHQVGLLDAFMLESFIGVWGASNPDNEWLMKRYRVQVQTKTIHGADYNASSSEVIEDYMKQCLFYAIFPFNNGNWTRDQSLYTSYLPVVKRLSMAGWEPITYAYPSVQTNSSPFRIERYGSFGNAYGIKTQKNEFYLTTRNMDREKPFTTKVVVDGAALGLPADILVYDLMTGQYLETRWDDNLMSFNVSLGPRDTKAFWLFKPDFSVESIAVDTPDPANPNTVKIVAYGTYELPFTNLPGVPLPTVQFYVNGETVGDAEIITLNTTHFVTSITFLAQETATYNITAFVDASENISEFDESNNIQHLMVNLPVSWRYHLTILVDTGPYIKKNAVAKIPFDSRYLPETETLDVASFRLVREDGRPVPCQYLEGFGSIPSYVVFPITTATANTTLRFTLYFDSLEYGPKMPLACDSYFKTVRKTFIHLKDERGVFLSPLSGTFFQINNRPDMYAWGADILSQSVGIWTFKNGINMTDGYEFFIGEIITNGPLVARVLYMHSAKGDYQSYGVLKRYTSTETSH